MQYWKLLTIKNVINNQINISWIFDDHEHDEDSKVKLKKWHYGIKHVPVCVVKLCCDQQ